MREGRGSEAQISTLDSLGLQLQGFDFDYAKSTTDDTYFCREDLLDKVLLEFQLGREQPTREQPTVLWLEGPAGAGKSSFVSALALLGPEQIDASGGLRSKVERARRMVAATHMCSVRGGRSHTLTGHGLVANLAHAFLVKDQRIAPRLLGFLQDNSNAKAKLQAYKKCPVDALLEGLLFPLAELKLEGVATPLVLIVDSLDEAKSPRAGGANEMSVLKVLREAWRERKRWPAWLRLIVTCRSDAGILEKMFQPAPPRKDAGKSVKGAKS